MDDYQKEIADLETQVEQMVEAEGEAMTIAELSMQLDILKAIYARALDLYRSSSSRTPTMHSSAESRRPTSR